MDEGKKDTAQAMSWTGPSLLLLLGVLLSLGVMAWAIISVVAS